MNQAKIVALTLVAMSDVALANFWDLSSPSEPRLEPSFPPIMGEFIHGVTHWPREYFYEDTVSYNLLINQDWL